MAWNRIIGQQRVKNLLQRTIASGRIAHAYLFHGIEGIGKDALALEFAKTLTCLEGKPVACGVCANCRKFDAFQQPNVQFVFALPVGKNEKQGDDPILTLSDDQVEDVKEQLAGKAADPYFRIEIGKANFIKINSVRALKRQTSLTSFEGGRKVFVVSNADQMNAEASNSLLKTLEEPSEDTILLLTTSDKDSLLQTIISRCQLIQCDPLSEEDLASALVDRDGAEVEQSKAAAAIANGSYSVARGLLSKDVLKAREEAVNYVRLALGNHRTLLLEHVEMLVAQYDKPSLERWLKQLQSWLHSALVHREAGKTILTGDEATTLQNFVAKFPAADLQTSLTRVDAAIAHLHKNVYLPLVLTNLALDLRTSIQSSRTE